MTFRYYQAGGQGARAWLATRPTNIEWTRSPGAVVAADSLFNTGYLADGIANPRADHAAAEGMAEPVRIGLA